MKTSGGAHAYLHDFEKFLFCHDLLVLPVAASNPFFGLFLAFFHVSNAFSTNGVKVVFI